MPWNPRERPYLVRTFWNCGYNGMGNWDSHTDNYATLDEALSDFYELSKNRKYTQIYVYDTTGTKWNRIKIYKRSKINK